MTSWWCHTQRSYRHFFKSLKLTNTWLKKVAHTRLPSVRFRSWSRFLAVSLQVMWVINPMVGCQACSYPATLKRAATNFAAWWTEAQWVWVVCLRLLPDSVAFESSTLATRLPSHPRIVDKWLIISGVRLYRMIRCTSWRKNRFTTQPCFCISGLSIITSR